MENFQVDRYKEGDLRRHMKSNKCVPVYMPDPSA